MSGHLSNKQSGPVLPSVILVTTNPDELFPQDYTGTMTTEKVVDQPTQAFFNEQLDKLHEKAELDTDVVYCFIPENCNFLFESSVAMGVDKLYEHPMIGTVYSDVLIKEDDLIIRHYLPAFHSNMLGGDIIINGPIFLKGSELLKHPELRFNDQLQLLYMHLFLHQSMSKIFCVHVAEALSIIYIPKNINMSSELKIVNQCLSQ